MNKNIVAKELVKLAKELMAAPTLDEKSKKITSDNAKKVLDMAKEAINGLLKVHAILEKMSEHTPLIPKNYGPTSKVIESLPEMIHGTMMNELESVESDMKQIIERNK